MPTAPRAKDVQAALLELADEEKARHLARFFKTGPGEYAEGDIFWGIQVPSQRAVAKQFEDLPLAEVKKLLVAKVHEQRLVALLILVRQFERGDATIRKGIVDLYLAHTEHVNNWDLVDSSAPQILGAWLVEESDASPARARAALAQLNRLAASSWLWDRRIAMVSTYAFIRAGRHAEATHLAERLLGDSHDLMHKAVGWMLRELGKRVDRKHLLAFLELHAARMPRTALRYAIEHLPEVERKAWLAVERAPTTPSSAGKKANPAARSRTRATGDSKIGRAAKGRGKASLAGRSSVR